MALERLTPGTPMWKRWGHHHLQRYLFAERFVIGKQVLDLACGVGYGSYSLRTMGARTVVGVDLDARAIAYALEHYQREGLRYEQGDALLWEGRGRFDVVVSFETIEHLSSPEKFLNCVASHLKPNGILIISAPNTLQYLKANPPIQNEHHLNEPDYALFQKWLATNFIIEAEWEQSPISMNGPVVSWDCQAALHLARQRWLRLGTKMESMFRRIINRPLHLTSNYGGNVNALAYDTNIMPLLPERIDVCNIFIFVCRLKSSSGLE